MGLNKTQSDDTTLDKKVAQVAGYMKERKQHSHEHRNWAIKFFVCEILNFVNVVAQIFITDAFLGGEFSKYGIHVLTATTTTIALMY